MQQNAEQARKQSSKDFKRDTGISLENFDTLTSLVTSHIAASYKENPNKSKGVPSFLSTSDRVLLTLYYLRHYITFKNLGDNFGISESYANKLYHAILTILAKELHVSGAKELSNTDLDTIIIDVTEQQIERPVKNQKKYYSGKKKSTQLKYS